MTAQRNLLSALVSAIGVVVLVAWALRQPAPSWPTGSRALVELGASLAAFAAVTVIRGMRWRSLAIGAGVPVSPAQAQALTVVGYALNNVLPARAGDAFRAVRVARDGVPLAAAAGTVLAERVLDGVVLGLLLAVALAMGPRGARLPEGLDGLLVLGVCAGIAALAAIVGVLSRAVRDFVGTLLGALGRIGARTVAIAVLASVLLWGLEALVYLLAAHAVGISMDLLGAVYVLAIANFVGALPAAPSAVGTYDVAVVFAANALGASGGAAVGYVLALRAVLFLPITVLGIAVIVARRRFPRPAAQAPDRAPEARRARDEDPSLPALVVVMPALDEAETLGDMIDGVRERILDQIEGSSVVVVDDGSRDETPGLLERAAAADPRVRVLRNDTPTGQGPATRRGLDCTRARWYLQMDADGQVDVGDFPRLWAQRGEADLVLGVRRLRSDPPHRRAITTMTRALVRRAAGRPLHDAATPLRLISGALWDDLRPFVGPRDLSFSVLVSVAAARRGWRVAEIDVSHHARRSGRSRLRGVAMLRILGKGALELRALCRSTSAART